MPTYVPPKKNTAMILYIGLVQQADTRLLKSSPTLAAGDFKVNQDGSAFANLGTLPTVTPAATVSVKVSLSAAEMNGDNCLLTCIDAAGAEWCDQAINFQTAARQIDDLAYPATSGRSMVVDAAGLVDATMVKCGPTGAGTAQTARDVGGQLDAAVSSRSTYAGGAVASVTAPVTVGTNNDKTGYALSAAGVTAIWAEVMDGTRTAVQAMRGFLAVLLGKASGLEVNAPKYRNIGDTKNVVDATTDANGNRTAVTLDLT